MDFMLGSVLKPPTEEQVRSFESYYEVNFPIDYSIALYSGNGGIPIRRTFMQGNRERLIERMLCLLRSPGDDSINGWYDINVVISQLGERLIEDEDIIGTNVIPIGALFAGDFICLDYRHNQHSPVVAVWDHERSGEYNPYLETISPTFSDFDRILK